MKPVCQPLYSSGPPLTRELTREKHERLFVLVTPSLAAHAARCVAVCKVAGWGEIDAADIEGIEDYIRQLSELDGDSFSSSAFVTRIRRKVTLRCQPI